VSPVRRCAALITKVFQIANSVFKKLSSDFSSLWMT
jgi:hypothetical protein